MTPAFRVERLLRLYRRASGGKGDFSRPFAEWPDTTKDRLRSEADVADEDHPFLAFVGAGEVWTLVTLKSLVWKLGDRIYRVSLEELHDVCLPDEAVARLELDGKRRIDRLKLVMKSGVCTHIPFEPGGPIAGLRHMLFIMLRQATGGKE